MSSSAYSLTEARRMLELCKTALEELVTGQAKSYRIGTREFTALDLDDLQSLIKYYSNLVDGLSGRTRNKRVARVVPRDL